MSTDAVSKAFALVEDFANKNRDSYIGIKKMVLVDQFGILHAPSAVGRSCITEQFKMHKRISSENLELLVDSFGRMGCG